MSGIRNSDRMAMQQWLHIHGYDLGGLSQKTDAEVMVLVAQYSFRS